MCLSACLYPILTPSPAHWAFAGIIGATSEQCNRDVGSSSPLVKESGLARTR
jgi:hypothetical protein